MKRRGFTLVELLVVIGIIAVLIAILLPALGKAKAMGRRTKCLANVRGMGHAAKMLMEDRQALPPRDPQYGWIPWLESYGTTVKMRQCPDALGEPSTPGSLGHPWLTQGTSNYTGAYTYNGYLYLLLADEDAIHNDGDDTGLVFSDAAPSAYRWPVNDDSGVIPVFSDGIWFDATPQPTDSVPMDLNSGFYGEGFAQQMGRVCIKRHGKAVNVSFLDGHAEMVPLQKLWTLSWNTTWVNNTNVVVP
jgi:prepilin-type N-terminal cleavage/methylation domain-containing protein/prepilin-type processing-associated H-X9-DG protein